MSASERARARARERMQVRRRSDLAGAVRAKQREADRALLEQRFRAGEDLVQPNRITLALDSRAMEGPDVDAACGAAEPDVDEWEAGTAAPTWHQLTLLADLTGYPVEFFFREVEPNGLDRVAGGGFLCGPDGCVVPEGMPYVEPYTGSGGES